MLTYFAKYSRFLSLFLIYSQIYYTESLDLSTLLTVFEYCAIHIYNYKSLTLSPSHMPVILNSKIPFEIEQEIHNYEIVRPVQCQAALYILPRDATKSIPSKNSNSGGRPYSSRTPRKRTYIRYNVLVDDFKQQSLKQWSQAFTSFLRRSRTISYGLIAQIDKAFAFLSDKLEIINILKISNKKKFVTISTSLKQFAWGNSIYQAVTNIDDIRNNKDVKWTLRSLPDVHQHDYQKFLNELNSKIIRVQQMFKMNISSPAYAQLLLPTKISEEGMENFLFAFTLLGSDINVTKPNIERKSKYMINPRITFNVPNGEVMMDKKPKESAYVSCSTAGGPIVYKYSFQEAVFDLIAIFDQKFYIGLIATYVAPPVVIGLLYHFLLKKRIQRKYWVSWHPFAWGFRALILQAGDRKFNKSRFGFTAFMVVPWLFVAIIISEVFRKHVFHVIRSGNGLLVYPWNELELQWNSGTKFVTDNERLAQDLNGNLNIDSFEEIADKVSSNGSITYISWESRVKAVAKLIGKTCENSWQPAKYKRVYSWNLRFASRYAYYALRSETRGWAIENLVDNSILYRLGVLEGESGIFGKWREALERLNDYRAYYDYGSWVVRIQMNASMVYLFYCGAGGFAVALVIWIAEWVFFKAYTEPRRKWKRKMDSVRKVIVSEGLRESGDSGRGSINSGGGIEDDVLVAAVLLVEERRKSGSLGEQIAGDDLETGEIKEVRTNVDKAVEAELEMERECVNIDAEIEKDNQKDEMVDSLEAQEKEDFKENAVNITIHVEEVTENDYMVDNSNILNAQENQEKNEGSIVEVNGSTEMAIGVTRSESRVSFAEQVEYIFDSDFELDKKAGVQLDSKRQSE